MTDQEILNHSVAKLLAQGRKSLAKISIRDGKDEVEVPSCCYRGNDDCCCAIGWVIPDDLYESKMEGSDIDSLIANFSTMKELFGDNDREFLNDLQSTHDRIPDSAKDDIFRRAFAHKINKLVQEYNMQLPDECVAYL